MCSILYFFQPHADIQESGSRQRWTNYVDHSHKFFCFFLSTNSSNMKTRGMRPEGRKLLL
jgi:hypothetical protein